MRVLVLTTGAHTSPVVLLTIDPQRLVDVLIKRTCAHAGSSVREAMPTTVPLHSSLQCKALSTSRLRRVGVSRAERDAVLRCAARVDRGSSGSALHSAEETDGDAGLVSQRAVAVVGEGSTAAPELVHLGIPEAAVEVKYDRGRPLRHASCSRSTGALLALKSRQILR